LQNIKTGKRLTREIKRDSHKSMEEIRKKKFPRTLPLINTSLKKEKMEKAKKND